MIFLKKTIIILNNKNICLTLQARATKMRLIKTQQFQKATL